MSCPETDLPRFLKGRITDVQVLFAVVEAFDALSDHCDSQCMPTLATLDVCGAKLNPTPVFDFVDSVVIFQRVVAGDVVILRVTRSPDYATTLIDLAGDGFQLHRDVQVQSLFYFSSHFSICSTAKLA